MYYQIFLRVGDRDSLPVCSCDSYASVCTRAASIMNTLDYAGVPSYVITFYSVCVDDSDSSTSLKLIYSYEKK